ncbi:MAG: YtxH domain-containing protein [Acidobacteria bacterium]|jgi:gas vesicle protein|nr:YtxH domain-containing protein [Acidobacteriota bacterium]
MDEDKKLSYFCLGLGIGVAVGILFAPKSGEETRDIIRSKAGEGKDYLRRRGEEMRDRAEDLVERGKSAVQRQKEQLNAAVDAGRQAYRESVSSNAGSES